MPVACQRKPLCRTSITGADSSRMPQETSLRRRTNLRRSTLDVDSTHSTLTEIQHAETRDRTGDLQIFSLTLSQLSCRGLCYKACELFLLEIPSNKSSKSRTPR